MKVTLEIMGKKYTGNGANLSEALEGMKVPFIRSKCVVSVGEKNRVLNAIQTSRLLSPHPLTRQIAIKNLSLFFE